MSTEDQFAANRRNAQKSTGPRTPEGKAQSRLNALKHGLCATALPILPGESHAHLEELGEDVREHYDPQTGLEHELVDQLVSLLWRLRRVEPAEAGIWAWYIQQGVEEDLTTARLTSMMSKPKGKPKAKPTVEPEVEWDEDDELFADLLEARGDAVLEMGRALVADGQGANALTKLGHQEVKLRRQIESVQRQLQDLQAARVAKGT